MWFWIILFSPLTSHAGLECHVNDIKKTQQALTAVAASECRESEKIKFANQQLRDLGYESLCDPLIIDRAKQLVAELRIDSWMSQDPKSCQIRINEASKLLRQLKAPQK